MHWVHLKVKQIYPSYVLITNNLVVKINGSPTLFNEPVGKINVIGIALFTVSSWVIWGAVAAEVFSVGGSPGRRYDQHYCAVLGPVCRLCGEYGTLLLIVACIIGGATWLRSLALSVC